MARWLGFTLALAGSTVQVRAQASSFAGDSQHTGQYSTPAQSLSRVRWSTRIDLKNTGGAAHYGAPLITPANTVLAPVRTTNGFQVSALDGGTGRLKYILATDYLVLSSSGWLLTYQPAIASPPSGARLYYAGAGGTVYYIENVDSDTPTAPVQQCFYTNQAGYSSNAAAFNKAVFINTPLTADLNGVVFFGFRIETNAPAPFSTNNSGFVRLEPGGNASYVFAGVAAGDQLIGRDSHSCAPALSNDGSILYVAVKSPTSEYYAYLLGLDSRTLSTKYKARLQGGEGVNVMDTSTASPTVGPDGDVFFGVYGNNSRGYLLHFSSDLTVQKPPSGFGWDHTPAIVPARLVSAYQGTSSYLLFSKYNNYANSGDGDGINKIALLDPNATQIDPHTSQRGLVEMREVLTVAGCTRDNQSSFFPYAVREWCINAAAVNADTGSIYAPSEDGRLYRWDLAANALSEVITLTSGFGEPYVPTVIGPDGTLYSLNGGTLFAVGSYTNLAITVYSSIPNLQTAVAGQPITFTAAVTNPDPSGPTPTGTVTFKDLTYRGFVATNATLAANVPLTNGLAAVTTSELLANRSNYLGSHFITATFNGGAGFPPGSATFVQKVHASATTITLNSLVPTPGSNRAIFSATVVANPSGAGTPTGLVSFWDGATYLTQVPLKTNGVAAFTNSNFSAGSHAITAAYVSDTLFAASTGKLAGTSPIITASLQPGTGAVLLAFTNICGAPFTVLCSADLSWPPAYWTEIGSAMETLPGQFQFIDEQPLYHYERYYCVRSP